MAGIESRESPTPENLIEFRYRIVEGDGSNEGGKPENCMEIYDWGGDMYRIIPPFDRDKVTRQIGPKAVFVLICSYLRNAMCHFYCVFFFIFKFNVKLLRVTANDFNCLIGYLRRKCLQ